MSPIAAATAVSESNSASRSGDEPYNESMDDSVPSIIISFGFITCSVSFCPGRPIICCSNVIPSTLGDVWGIDGAAIRNDSIDAAFTGVVVDKIIKLIVIVANVNQIDDRCYQNHLSLDQPLLLDATGLDFPREKMLLDSFGTLHTLVKNPLLLSSTMEN
ncbi:hypothetical protein BLOT_013195 [Blomia tropicalis]|nr:hypothetical protein BLOT_013195 [Blomia tropicalis]